MRSAGNPDVFQSRDTPKKPTGCNKELLLIPGAVHPNFHDRLDVILSDKLEAFFRPYMG